MYAVHASSMFNVQVYSCTDIIP